MRDEINESAPRGSKTGTQGLKGAYERSKVPYQLCKELLEVMGMTQTEIINKLNSIYPGLDLVEVSDPYNL